MALIKELIRITKDQQDNIIKYQKENKLTTKAEAYRHLLSSLSKKNGSENNGDGNLIKNGDSYKVR